tara:strand:+ start:14307 stop:14540 length:234 start_codon:yes stop_codon:yes gene_type:complete
MLIDIPYQQIPEETLRRMLEEFVTREGTNYGEQEFTLPELVAQVKLQLETKKAVIQYDDESQSCHIILADTLNSDIT